MSTVSPLNSYIVGAPQGPWKEGVISMSTAALEITDIPDDVISADFIMTNIVPTNDARALYMRTSSNNGSSFDSTAGDYSYTGRFLLVGSSNYNGSASASFIYLSHNALGTAANEVWNQRVRLYRPLNNANFTKITSNGCGTDSSTNSAVGFGGGVRESAGIVNAVQFFFNVGNIASMNWKVYLNR